MNRTEYIHRMYRPDFKKCAGKFHGSGAVEQGPLSCVKRGSPLHLAELKKNALKKSLLDESRPDYSWNGNTQARPECFKNILNQPTQTPVSGKTSTFSTAPHTHRAEEEGHCWGLRHISCQKKDRRARLHANPMGHCQISKRLVDECTWRSFLQRWPQGVLGGCTIPDTAKASGRGSSAQRCQVSACA